MDPDKWEECDPNDTSGVMISNLPLLFVNGMPTALPLMSVEDFEKFIPFMVRCSTGEDTSVPWSQLPRPPWWPARLPFRIPSTSSSGFNKTIMIRIVERCYSYHGCPYLLQFCASLIEVMPSCGYRFTDNRDGTSSMYHGTTGKLLVTFRNENRDYDKVPDPSKTPQKKLISSIHHGKEKKRNIMVQPPISDVYLCDKCDDEFQSLKEVHNHEKQCTGNSSVLMSMPSPEPEIIDDVLYTDEQAPFLSQFGLMPTKNSGIAPFVSPVKKQRQPSKTVSYNHFHFDSVDVSSPFGRRILARLRNYGTLEMPQHNVMRYERYIYAPAEDYEETKVRHSNRWIVTYRRKRKTRDWCHLLCFTQEQKDERRRTIATGLNYRSRCLLPKCRRLVVHLKRLRESSLRPPAKAKEWPQSFPLIDLTKLNGVTITVAGSPPPANGLGIIRVPIDDPLALPTSGELDKSREACQRILNCRTVTITKVCKPTVDTNNVTTANGHVDRVGNSISSYNNNNSNGAKASSSIEIIDLLSDDEDVQHVGGDCSVSTVAMQRRGSLSSKNGPSHWSSIDSCESGRSSRDLTNGCSPNISPPSCPSDTPTEPFTVTDADADVGCDAKKSVLVDIQNFKSDTTGRDSLSVVSTPALSADLPADGNQLADLPADGNQLSDLPADGNPLSDLPVDGNQLADLPVDGNQLADLHGDGNQLAALPVDGKQLADLPVDGKQLVAKRGQRSEVSRLKSDECRELNSRGLEHLHDFNGCSRRILTRRSARNRMPMLTTRNSQFLIKPLLKTQLLIESLRHAAGARRPKSAASAATKSPGGRNLDENGNTTVPFRGAEKAAVFFDDTKAAAKMVAAKRTPTQQCAYGRTAAKRPRLVRELLSLSRDECKEIRCKGFHPADVIRVVTDAQRDHSGDLMMSGGKTVHSAGAYFVSTKKLYGKLSVLAIDSNLVTSADSSGKTRSLERDNIYRQLYLLNNRQLHTSAHVQDLITWSLTASNTTRPGQLKAPMRKENPRRAHRQLIRSQSGMCVLSYHLPRLR